MPRGKATEVPKLPRSVGALLLGLLTTVAASLHAQSSIPVSARLRFDVASVKPITNENVTSGPSSPTHFFRGEIELRYLIVFAYDLPEYRVVGGPEWTDSALWQVSARVARPASRAEMQEMVRSLLADRFGLRSHVETRRLPIYNLVVARRDGRLGPKATPAEVDCVPFLTGARPMKESPVDKGTGFPRCSSGASFGPEDIAPRLNGVPMSHLADYVERTLRRRVIDKTGVSGTFDFTLSHRHEGTFPVANDGVHPPDQIGDTPSLSTALQEQLGLRLESDTGPVDVLVIDDAKRPDPD